MPTHTADSELLDHTAKTVLSVMAGAPLTEAAAQARIEPTVLADAVEVFRQAGLRALSEQAVVHDWWHIYLKFTDWPTAEPVAARHLLPLLQKAEADGLLTRWWFIRKHPCWRLRLHIKPGIGVKTRLGDAFNTMVTEGHLTRWWPGIYEPETVAFGGGPAMDTAHDLFHADSHAVLDHAGNEPWPLGRRELSVLLCTTMFHAAGLEWYEIGDVWRQVSQERPMPDDLPLDRLPQMTDQIRKLLLADTEPAGALFHDGGPAACAARWADAFRHAGTALSAGARAGELERGLRRILAYHVIFHWNRLGLATNTQAILAKAAQDAVLGSPKAPGTPAVSAWVEEIS